MKYRLLTALLLVFSLKTAFAQHQHFQTSGTIEYEKTANMYALIQKEVANSNEDDNPFAKSMLEEYKKNKPQFKKLKATLTFNADKSIFNPIAPAETPGYNFFDTPAANQNNIVYTDFNSDATVIQKKVFEETFLLKDSTRKIKWKLTADSREIAGYTCRRANGIMMDSIYVVAFYTDRIHVSGGPESFTGLPGMILGVALPHENVTWFATKVTDVSIDPQTIAPPKKGKIVNRKELKTTLSEVMKNWGKYALSYLKAFML